MDNPSLPPLTKQVEQQQTNNQALLRAIAPYDRVSLSHLAHELNGVPEADVEALLVSLILDGAVHGYIDQACILINGVYVHWPWSRHARLTEERRAGQLITRTHTRRSS